MEKEAIILLIQRVLSLGNRMCNVYCIQEVHENISMEHGSLHATSVLQECPTED